MNMQPDLVLEPPDVPGRFKRARLCLFGHEYWTASNQTWAMAFVAPRERHAVVTAGFQN